jgi:TRAP-type C4-dicarboxylate transport system permease small subunit
MLDRALTVVERALVFGTYLALMAMMVLITVDAILRYAFAETLPDVYHLTELYLMPMVIFFALANTQRLDGHVSVSLFDRFLPDAARRSALLLVYLAASACFSAIAWKSGQTAWSDIAAWRVTAGVVPWPTGLSRAIVPVGSAVLAIRLFVDGLKLVGRSGNREVKSI